MAYKSKAMQKWAGENQPSSVENKEYKSSAMRNYEANMAKKAQQEEEARQQALIAQQEAEAPRRANLKDLTLGSIGRGYATSKYGNERYDEIMLGTQRQAKQAQKAKEKTEQEKYNFAAQSGLGKAVSGAGELIGQQIYNLTNRDTLASVGANVAGAAAVGAAVPLPEEVVTMPTAVARGLKLGSAATMYQISAAQAYDEMVESGVSEATAKKVANVIGAGMGALEGIQADELLKSAKILKGVKGEASEKALSNIMKALGKLGVSTALETGEEVAQETVSMIGQDYAKAKEGIKTFTPEEYGQRLKDTAVQSALSFGLLGGVGAVGGAMMNRNNINAQTNDVKSVENEAKSVENSTEMSNNVENTQKDSRTAVKNSAETDIKRKRYGEEGKKLFKTVKDDQQKLAEFDTYYREGVMGKAMPAVEGVLNETEATSAYNAGKADGEANRTAYAQKQYVVSEKAGLNKESAANLPLGDRIVYNTIGKAFGKEVVVVPTIKNENGTRSNAKIDLANGIIYIAQDAHKGAAGGGRIALAHEVVHDMRVAAPAEFDNLARLVTDYHKKFSKYDSKFADTAERYELDKGKIDYYDMMEEMVADFIADNDGAERIVDMLSTDKPLAQKFIDSVKKVVVQLGKLALDKETRKIVNEWEDLVKQLEKAVKATEEKAKTQTSDKAKTSDIRESKKSDEYLELAKDPEKNKAKLQEMVDKAAKEAMPDSKIVNKDGSLKYIYHGTDDMFYEFNPLVKGGVNGVAEGFGIYTSDSTEVTSHYGDRQIKMFANIKRPASSTKKTITTKELIALIKDTCEKEATRMVEEDGYDSVNDALRDTWVSNSTYTYDKPMSQVYREVANDILRMNSSDMAVIQEVMFMMAIKDYESATRFYNDSLIPVTGFDGIVTQWDNATTGKKSNIILAFNSNQLKSADAVTYNNNGNIIPLSERFKEDNADIRYSVFKGEPEQKQLVSTAKNVFPYLKAYMDETVYRIATDEEFYEKTGWAYTNGTLNHNDAVEFTKIIENKQIGTYTPQNRHTKLYYLFINDKIIVTDGDFEIPTIFCVYDGKGYTLNNKYFWEKINGQTYIVQDFDEFIGEEEDFSTTWRRNRENYDSFKKRLQSERNSYRSSAEQQNRGRNSAEDSSVEREIQSGINTRDSRMSEPDIPEGYKERGFAESSRESDSTPDLLKQELIEDPVLYVQAANAETKKKADTIFAKGVDYAETEFEKLLAKGEPVAVPLGANIMDVYYEKAKAEKDADKAEVYRTKGNQIFRKLAAKLTKSGQFSQATVIALSRNDPLIARNYAELDIDELNLKGQQIFGKKWKDFALTESEKKAFEELKVGDKKGIENLYKQINTRIAKEYPSTFWQKFIETSRISMLLNPRTNVKNIASNMLLRQVTRVSGKLSSQIQKAYSYYNKNFSPTQALMVNQNTKKLAKEIWSGVKDTFETTNKYKDNINVNKRDIQVFKEGIGTRVMENIAPGTLHKLNTLMGKEDAGLMETTRNATYWLLEWGDNKYVEKNFLDRLGSYLQAQGITEINEANKETIDAAVQVAFREAMRATFKDDTALSKWMASIKHTNSPVINAMMEMIMPFTKTPANIAMRGIDYSPVGIINTINKARKGADASEVIDELSKNLLGSALIAFGAWLFSKGLVTGGEPENEKQAAFLKQQGWLPYAVKVGDRYVTYDWAQPAAIPVIMGVTIMESLEEGRLGVVDAVKNAGVASFNQWIELSPLQSLQEVMGGYGTVGENLLNTAVEMPQRLIPSALGATARTADTTQRVTYSKGNVAQTQKDIAKSKIPGASQTLPVAYDTWGNAKQRDNSTLGAAFNQYINPSSAKLRKQSEVDLEIDRLYESLGDETVYPRKAEYTIKKDGETYQLDNKEYSEYQRIMGQLSYDGVKALMAKPSYSSLSDVEKLEIIKDIYDNAFEKAKYTIMEGQGYKKTEEDIRTAKETKIKQAYLEATPENIAEYYIAYYILNNADSDKTVNGTTIAGSQKKNGINRLMELGFTRSEARRLYDRLKG